MQAKMRFYRSWKSLEESVIVSRPGTLSCMPPVWTVGVWSLLLTPTVHTG